MAEEKLRNLYVLTGRRCCRSSIANSKSEFSPEMLDKMLGRLNTSSFFNPTFEPSAGCNVG